MSDDNGTEADYMHDCQLAASGGDEDYPDPTHEVVNRKNDWVYCGSRASCWAYKQRFGGYVREFTGYDNDCDYAMGV